jgi:hypothetical protein
LCRPSPRHNKAYVLLFGFMFEQILVASVVVHLLGKMRKAGVTAMAAYRPLFDKGNDSISIKTLPVS